MIKATASARLMAHTSSAPLNRHSIQSPGKFSRIPELLNDGRCNRYANLIHYLETLYDGKEAFALCFCAELPVRGNHTNNFAEAQLLVLKDTILRRVKEYNVVGLIDKVTLDLEDHYKDKLFVGYFE